MTHPNEYQRIPLENLQLFIDETIEAETTLIRWLKTNNIEQLTCEGILAPYPA